MSEPSTLTPPSADTTIASWRAANAAYIQMELHWLRAVCARRIAWLRHTWRHQPMQSFHGVAISDTEADWLLAGEDPAAETAFYETDADARAACEHEDAARRDADTFRERMAQSGAPPALDTLARTFNLTRGEEAVLLASAAPDIDPAFERLFAYMQDDVTRRWATPHIAATLFYRDAAAPARERLHADGPLRRFRLIAWDTSHGGVTLRVDERMTDYLFGINNPASAVTDCIELIPVVPLSGRDDATAEDLAARCQARWRAGASASFTLVGAGGSGRRAIAARTSSHADLRLCEVSARALVASRDDAGDLPRLLARDAALCRLAYVVDLTHAETSDLAPHSALRERVDRWAAQVPTAVFTCVREPLVGDRSAQVVRVATPGATEQVEMWRASIGGAAADIAPLAQEFTLGPHQIARCVARAPANGAGPRVADLRRACREEAGAGLSSLTQRIDPRATWNDIVLPGAVAAQLRDVGEQVAHRAHVYDTWGFGAALGRGRGIAALFSGASGVGKTMAAEVLAHDLDLDLFRIDLSAVVSKYIGETEKNLRQVFDAAEHSGAVLFFDEADALFGKRSEVKDSHDRYANIEIDYLLTRMEDYRGLAILATNRKSLLDVAFLRRLRFVIDFPFPDVHLRGEMWRRMFPQAAETDALDWARLARLEIAGGNIRTITVNAAFLAAARREPIRMSHIMQAARREYAKIEKLITEAEFGPFYVERGE